MTDEIEQARQAVIDELQKARKVILGPPALYGVVDALAKLEKLEQPQTLRGAIAKAEIEPPGVDYDDAVHDAVVAYIKSKRDDIAQLRAYRYADEVNFVDAIIALLIGDDDGQ